MDIVQPSILSGFMELSPEDQVLFNKIRDIAIKNFRNYGFWPIDTPAIEKSEILFAKGGGETEKQVYRIEKGEHSQDQALRFDLTVPLARYVAQNASDLAFPFRRYQVAKVWRGERSQKGRYREFYQADVDIIGRNSLSLLNDAEIPSVMDKIFKEIGVGKAVFHINNRKLLNAFFNDLEIRDSAQVLRAIDKLAKIGEVNVASILEDEGIDEEKTARIFSFIKGGADNSETLAKLEKEPLQSQEYKEALEDLKFVYKNMLAFGIDEDSIVIDLSITRGLDYYTGTVYETFLKGHESIGSICSGGRYDNLASNFSKESLPGVGLSIGLTRLFYQLRAGDIIQPEKGDYIKALVIAMGEDDRQYAIDVVNRLRSEGLVCQLDSEGGKMKKKFSYADKLGAGYAIIIGESERLNKEISIKDLLSGKQESMSLEDAVELIKANRKEVVE